MGVTEKAFESFIFDNRYPDNLYFTNESLFTSYTDTEFSYLWGDGGLRFTYYGQVPDLSSRPLICGDLLNSAASVSPISRFTVTAGPYPQNDLPNGTLLMEGSVPIGSTIAYVSVPATHEFIAKYYSGADTFISTNS